MNLSFSCHPQANTAFQEAELERIRKLNACMRAFCELERAALSARSELLTTLEQAIQSQNGEEDMALFIAQERNVELTHKYTYAVGLMESHRHRMYGASSLPARIAFTYSCF